MPLPPEIISALKEKAAVEKEARKSAEEARRKAEAADGPRVKELVAEMKSINDSIRQDKGLQQGLELFIEEDPRRVNYRIKGYDPVDGLPIASKLSQAVVLTPMGIKAFEIHRQITWPGEA